MAVGQRAGTDGTRGIEPISGLPSVSASVAGVSKLDSAIEAR